MSVLSTKALYAHFMMTGMSTCFFKRKSQDRSTKVVGLLSSSKQPATTEYSINSLSIPSIKMGLREVNKSEVERKMGNVPVLSGWCKASRRRGFGPP